MRFLKKKEPFPPNIKFIMYTAFSIFCIIIVPLCNDTVQTKKNTVKLFEGVCAYVKNIQAHISSSSARYIWLCD